MHTHLHIPRTFNENKGIGKVCLEYDSVYYYTDLLHAQYYVILSGEKDKLFHFYAS